MKLTGKITANFKWEEFMRSQTAPRYGIDNSIPDNDVADNIRALCMHVLEPLRNRLGPITVTSGYRCPKLNALVGGSKTSQHMKGQAADIVPVHCGLATLIREIRDFTPFDQLIWEFGQWIHVSYDINHEKNRRMILRAYHDGGPKYELLTPADLDAFANGVA